jgi:nicotinamide-nucleotide amidase
MARLTDVPGSSAWFSGGIVAYDNAVKVRDLGVPPELLERVGAVSEPVAAAMAEGVREQLGVDVGIGVTGIAGPAGGTLEKPVGTVAIAVAAGHRPTITRLAHFPGDRETVRRHSTFAALDMVRSVLAD